MITLTKKNTHNSTTVVQPESLKALTDGIQQERHVRQQHRAQSLKALNDGISTRPYVCRSLVGTTINTTMYSIDYIHYISTTTKYQPEMPDYVNNKNI